MAQAISHIYLKNEFFSRINRQLIDINRHLLTLSKFFLIFLNCSVKILPAPETGLYVAPASGALSIDARFQIFSSSALDIRWREKVTEPEEKPPAVYAGGLITKNGGKICQ